jgi:hypothetical protein
MVFAAAVNLKRLAETLNRAGLPRGTVTIGYVFGGYPSSIRWLKLRPLQAVWSRDRALRTLDRVFVGIEDGVATLEAGLRMPVSCIPMAADVAAAAAWPNTGPPDRPSSITASDQPL